MSSAVSVTPIIRSSAGAASDIPEFYSSVYSTTHNPRILGSKVEASHYFVSSGGRWYPKPFAESTHSAINKSGYAKNVLPHVEYDVKVDETKTFHIDASETSSSASNQFKQPRLAQTKLDINLLGGSGFTKIPTYNVTQDGVSKKSTAHTTLMKESFPDKSKFFKSHISRNYNVIASSTAFVTDNNSDLKFRGPFPDGRNSNLPKKSFETKVLINEVKMRPDGYTRSEHKKEIYLGDGIPETINSPSVYGHQVHSSDPTRWIRTVEDPHYIKSTTSILHKPLDQIKAIQSVLHSDIKIGKKTETGSVRNISDQVLSETKLTYYKEKGIGIPEAKEKFPCPSKPEAKADVKVSFLPASAFSINNRKDITNAAKTDAEIYSGLHPTAALARWNTERGLHTARPTQKKYMLQI